MLAIMAAPMAGINPMDPGFIATLIIVVTISSFGVAGVGGGATFASLIVLSVMNLPGLPSVRLLISVEPLIDMGRTALNVSGGMTSECQAKLPAIWIWMCTIPGTNGSYCFLKKF